MKLLYQKLRNFDKRFTNSQALFFLSNCSHNNNYIKKTCFFFFLTIESLIDRFPTYSPSSNKIFLRRLPQE